MTEPGVRAGPSEIHPKTSQKVSTHPKIIPKSFFITFVVQSELGSGFLGLVVTIVTTLTTVT